MNLIDPPKQHSMLWKLFHTHHWYLNSSFTKMKCECGCNRVLTINEARVAMMLNTVRTGQQKLQELEGILASINFDPQPPIKS